MRIFRFHARNDREIIGREMRKCIFHARDSATIPPGATSPAPFAYHATAGSGGFFASRLGDAIPRPPAPARPWRGRRRGFRPWPAVPAPRGRRRRVRSLSEERSCGCLQAMSHVEWKIGDAAIFEDVFGAKDVFAAQPLRKFPHQQVKRGVAPARCAFHLDGTNLYAVLYST